MATFRFTLRTPLTAVKFGTESVRNWQDVKPSIVKNKDYRGIFQTDDQHSGIYGRNSGFDNPNY